MRNFAVIAVVFLAASILLWAATATVTPTGDTATGSWNTAPLWSKVDEDIDTPGADLITSGNNPGAANVITFSVTCPVDTGTITAAALRIRANGTDNGARTVSLAVAWSATATTNVSTGTLTTTMTNYTSGNQSGLSVSKATCNSSTITITPSTAGTGTAETASIDAVNLDITYTAQTRTINPMLITKRIELR